MRDRQFTFPDADGEAIFVYEWLPEEDVPVRGVVQIAHGMAETAARYERFAGVLTGAGYAVYANDHRGHGRTAGSPERFGVIGENGFQRMAEAMGQLTDLIRVQFSDVPFYVFGHSMGSFLTQKYMYLFPGKVDGIVLSGTNGPQKLLGIGSALARRLAARKGDQHRSELLMRLTLGSYNRQFRPNRTPFDWLSRDEREVDLFAADPDCGFAMTAGFWIDFFRGLQEIHDERNMRQIPVDMPVYLFSGELDPVGRRGKGVVELAGLYRELGLRHVTYKLYPQGRHEMLNEINRDAVMQDVLHWLDEQTARQNIGS
ncbi:alpha/beta hydrolase [Paenibacillus tyrfis]|uniref:alpha/beta hydrolase n=1 Tax=Paenibacillus TaxID=44249 RepID=UPI002490B38A|nr:alpha/beta hydrolase [Paenibacillus tyrfis]GLI08173.1 alpha/beta hydrolase [Paenibacillus tyrfis]GMX64060.1 alpha/beta hydrolase [Paenibacillus elgii]